MRAATFSAALLILSTAAAGATTCTQAVARCKVAGASKPYIDKQCQAAGDACKTTGIFYGPVSGTTWKGLRKE